MSGGDALLSFHSIEIETLIYSVHKFFACRWMEEFSYPPSCSVG